MVSVPNFAIPDRELQTKAAVFREIAEIIFTSGLKKSDTRYLGILITDAMDDFTSEFSGVCALSGSINISRNSPV